MSSGRSDGSAAGASGERPTTSDPTRDPTRRDVRWFGSVYLRGMAMGASDIVPGVSGGTMALILGIYEHLIDSLRSLARRPFLGNLMRGRLAQALAAVDAPFLAAVAAGILTSVLSLSHLLAALLEARPAFVHAFFFGLILASVVLVARRVRRRTGSTWLLFGLGAMATYLLVGATPAQTPDQPWFLFLSGVLAVSALLLPGISGALVLVLLGKYSYVLEAVNHGDAVALASVAAGAGVGLLSFTQILGWLFRRFHDATLALLSGVMLGSLRRLWPWQFDATGVGHAPPLPADPWSLQDGAVWAILLALVGAAVVAWMDVASEHGEFGESSRERN